MSSDWKRTITLGKQVAEMEVGYAYE